MDRSYNVLCYVRPYHEAFFRHLCHELFGAEHTTLLSDFRGTGSMQVNRRFYDELRADATGLLPSFLPEAVAEDMAFRCRFLRGLPRTQQRRLLAAMVTAMDDALDRVRPDMVLSITVDCYVLDVLRFCSQMRGIPFLGMVGTMVNGYFMLTGRGEHNAFRHADDNECERVLNLLESPEYRPAYLPPNASSALSVGKRYIRETAKAVYFPMRQFAERDRWNLYYAGSAARARDCIAIANLAPGRFYESAWAARASRRDGRRLLYLPLQFTPECNVDYWCLHRDFLLFEEGVLRVVDGLASSVILVKEHPSMVGYRRSSFYKELRRRPHVVLVPPTVPSLDLIDSADAVLSWSGSAGIEAVLLSDTPVLDFGEPYYASGRATRPVRTATELGDAERLLDELLAAPPLDRNEKIEYVRNILAGYVAGSLEHIRDFSADNPAVAASMADTARSLDANLDQWFGWASRRAGHERETVA